MQKQWQVLSLSCAVCGVRWEKARDSCQTGWFGSQESCWQNTPLSGLSLPQCSVFQENSFKWMRFGLQQQSWHERQLLAAAEMCPCLPVHVLLPPSLLQSSGLWPRVLPEYVSCYFLLMSSKEMCKYINTLTNVHFHSRCLFPLFHHTHF